jgi:hypothetical protein
MRSERKDGLLAWQWKNYPDAHRDRLNLVLHVITAPLFIAGTLAVLVAPWVGWLLLPAGLGAMAAALGIQGRGHRREANAPVRFASVADAIARLFVENWVTFPRFVLSGGLVRSFSTEPNGDLRESPPPCAPSSFSTRSTKTLASSDRS